jgi:hypothetical protein
MRLGDGGTYRMLRTECITCEAWRDLFEGVSKLRGLAHGVVDKRGEMWELWKKVS